jgi:hypothetical protein
MKQIFVHKNILKKIFSFALILTFLCVNLIAQESDNQNKIEKKVENQIEEKTVSQVTEKKLILKKRGIHQKRQCYNLST